MSRLIHALCVDPPAATHELRELRVALTEPSFPMKKAT